MSEQTFVIICGMPEGSFAVMAPCGFCDRETRSVHQVVYGGYSSNVICGECGTVAYDGEYDPKAKSGQALEAAEESIAEVAEAWKNGDQSTELWTYLDSCLHDPEPEP